MGIKVEWWEGVEGKNFYSFPAVGENHFSQFKRVKEEREKKKVHLFTDRRKRRVVGVNSIKRFSDNNGPNQERLGTASEFQEVGVGF